MGLPSCTDHYLHGVIEEQSGERDNINVETICD